MTKGSTSVGIYIGQNKLSVVQAKKAIGGPRIVRFVQTNIIDKKREKIVEAISRALKEMGVQTEDIFVALPSKEAMIRFLELPRVPKAEQEMVIKLEAQKLIPFRPEDLVYDFELRERLATKKTDVIFAAVNKEIVRDYLNIFGQAGLEVKALEPAPFSLMRTLRSNGQIKRGKITAIVDVNQDEGNINIIKDDFPCLTRDFSLVSPQFVSEVEKKTLLQSLSNEILISFSYFRRQFPQDTVDGIILCGEVDLKGWDESLNKELGIPVELVRPWGVVGEESLPPSSGLYIATGSALRGLMRFFPEINLYGLERVPYVQKREEVTRVAFISASVVCLFLLAFYITMANKVAKIRGELKSVKSELKQSELVTDSLSRLDLETLKVNLLSKLSTFQRIAGERSYLTVKFNELPMILPDGLWLTHISSEEKIEEKGKKISRNFVIKGAAYMGDNAKEIDVISNFFSRLIGSKVFSKEFKNIKLVSITRSEFVEIPITLFEITCYTE